VDLFTIAPVDLLTIAPVGADGSNQQIADPRQPDGATLAVATPDRSRLSQTHWSQIVRLTIRPIADGSRRRQEEVHDRAAVAG
jgi:hypothetical protein